MDIFEAMEKRHSVRSYTDQAINAETIRELNSEIAACNAESGLHIQLVTNEPEAFSGMMAHYGKFRGVENYIALIGKKSSGLHEAIGYYGERIALKAQQLGLNTCWVAMTFSKGKSKRNCVMNAGDKMVCVLSLGYGSTQGTPHTNKPIDSLYNCSGTKPDWFQKGMDAVMLAPTATNQQKFRFTLDGNQVKAETTGGFYSDVDLGIVKYHFEVGAGKENFVWQ